MTYGTDLSNLYQQNTDIELIATLIPYLRNQTFIDIGAEKGIYTEFLTSHGLTGVLFEPLPKHTPLLHHLAERTKCTFFPYAIDYTDRQTDFYVAYDHQNNPLEYFSSLHPLNNDHRIKHIKASSVTCRSLDSLYREGCFDKEIGIIKIDTEGNDLNILKGMTEINSEILICEFFMPNIYAGWEQGHPLGLIKEATEQLGFNHFISIKRFDEFEAVSINTAEFVDAVWGNLIFIKDHIFMAAKEALEKIIHHKQISLIKKIIDNTQSLRTTCAERLKLIENSSQNEQQLRKNEEMHLNEIAFLRNTAQERLDVIQKNNEKEAHYQNLKNRLDLLETSLYRIEQQTANIITRTKRLCRPRLGILYQYNPRPLFIPRNYEAKMTLEKYPSISIVTPSFNQGQFLERTILSISKQEYPELEYIIQDGGSTDNSVEVIKRFPSSVTHWESAKDNGQSNAINKGFRHSKGEIMAYLNSDDILLPGSLAYIADFFNKHPEIDVVYGHRVVINEIDFEIGRWILPPHNSSVLSWVDYVPQETLFWRRSIWEKAGSHIDESFRFAMDWDLLIRFRDAGAKFKRLPRFLGGFRVHTQQKTSSQISDIGALEMERLRKRCHKRTVSNLEIKRNILPYLLHHVFCHKLYRAGLLPY